jgi:hypothetical protein
LLKVGGLNPKIDIRGIDFSGVDFSDEDLRGVSFLGCRLTGANFQRALVQKDAFDEVSLSSGPMGLDFQNIEYFDAIIVYEQGRILFVLVDHMNQISRRAVVVGEDLRKIIHWKEIRIVPVSEKIAELLCFWGLLVSYKSQYFFDFMRSEQDGKRFELSKKVEYEFWRRNFVERVSGGASIRRFPSHLKGGVYKYFNNKLTMLVNGEFNFPKIEARELTSWPNYVVFEYDKNYNSMRGSPILSLTTTRSIKNSHIRELVIDEVVMNEGGERKEVRDSALVTSVIGGRGPVGKLEREIRSQNGFPVRVKLLSKRQPSLSQKVKAKRY